MVEVIWALGNSNLRSGTIALGRSYSARWVCSRDSRTDHHCLLRLPLTLVLRGRGAATALEAGVYSGDNRSLDGLSAAAGQYARTPFR